MMKILLRSSLSLLLLLPLGTAFQGVYSDPNHPAGYRVIVADDSGEQDATLKLQDDPKGAIFALPVKVDLPELTIDFSPKGGPSDAVGTVLEEGDIQFPDGNVWKKAQGGVEGVYSDSNHPGGYRVIRQRGEGFVVELKDDSDVIEIPAKSPSSKEIEFDFSPKGGPSKLSGTVEKGTITFPDGNVWTRL